MSNIITSSRRINTINSKRFGQDFAGNVGWLPEYQRAGDMKFSGNVVVDCGTLAGWTLFLASAELVSTPPNGPQRHKASAGTSIKFTPTPATGMSVTSPTFAAIPGTPQLNIWVYIEDYTKIPSLWTVYLGDSAFSNYFLAYPSIRPHNGWHCITIFGALTVGAGSPTWPTVTKFKINFGTDVLEGGNIILDRVAIGGGGQSYVSLIWDDGNDSDYKLVAPLLNRYNLVGNFAIINSVIGSTNYLTTDHLRQLSESGHRLLTHGDLSLNTFGTIDLAKANIQFNKVSLDALGVNTDSDIYVYPGGTYSYTPGSLAIPEYLEQSGFFGAFTAANGAVSNEDNMKYLCNRAPLTSNTTASGFFANLDAYLSCGLSMATCAHQIMLSGATGPNINIDVLEEILSGIASRRNEGKLAVVSAREFLDFALIG
jgi:peptidoglycan/xylan/chitin deacetylase (PgdA/CDA1 family)